jgi:hypothetical protein
MFVVLLGWAGSLGAQGEGEAGVLDELVTSPALWAMDADAFQKAYPGYGFSWMSAAKEGARADGKRVPLTLFGKPVGETIVMFAGGNPKQVQISLHNRGDDGTIREDRFFGLIEEFKAALTAKTGVAAVDRGKDNKSATRAEGYQWTTDDTAYLLEFSAQREVKTRDIPFRSEFIRLRTAKAVKQTFMEEALAKEERVSRADLPANVVRKDGDTFIQGVPMVDQGEKGYCVVASTARVFGYYGMQVDQHEIAQIANASATEGTNSSGMIDALDRIAGRVKVRVKTHEEMEYSDLGDLVGDYNRMAKRKGIEELTTDSGYNLWNHFDAFDPAVLKETRMRDAAGFKGFKAEIQRSIDAGVPLLWTVTVGLFPEEKINPQSRGGHMRMIIGYNWEKNQVIYTDSWGAGHEFKRWGVEEAFCSTHGLYSVQPIR